MTADDEPARLRRQLRALAAVNHQLRDQLEALTGRLAATETPSAPGADPLEVRDGAPPPVGAAIRRAEKAHEWRATLAAGPTAEDPSDPADAPGPPELVIRPDGAVYVVEGDRRRRIRAGMLTPAIEGRLGNRRVVTDEELARWTEAAPMEVYEGPKGGPFLVLGGQRVPVHGLPLPHPVPQDVVDALPETAPLDVLGEAPPRAEVARRWFPALTSPAGDPALVVAPDRALWLVEGTVRRRLRAALLVPTIERLVGARRTVTAEELEGWIEGPPLEVLEAPTGAPFVVLGGERRPLRGLPLPYPVTQHAADALTEGGPLDVNAVQSELLAREQWRTTNPDPVGELHALVEQKGGVAPTAKSIVRSGRRRLTGKPKPKPNP